MKQKRNVKPGLLSEATQGLKNWHHGKRRKRPFGITTEENQTNKEKNKVRRLRKSEMKLRMTLQLN